MAQGPSPLLGYNTNVRHKGKLYHIQTEDSGIINPHVFTHLFHGGVIISTRKLVYDNGSDEGAIKTGLPVPALPHLRYLDLDLITTVRQTWQFYRDRRPETYDDLTEQLP